MSPRTRSARWLALATAAAALLTVGWTTEDLTPAHDFLINYPRSSEKSFNENTQGITHDAANWFITQERRLHKIPVTADLANPPSHPTTGIPVSGYNHMGAPDYARGYVFVPLTGDNKPPAIAVYRAYDLAFRGIAEMPSNLAGIGWVAIRRSDNRLFTSASTLGTNNPGLSYLIDFTKLTGTVSNPKISPFFGVNSFRIYGRAGATLTLNSMQGGTFSPRGDLYTSNGWAACVYDDKVPASPLRRFRLLDSGVFQEVARSNNGTDPFNYEVQPGENQEPEGLTWWDLNTVSHHYRVSGQLHALLLDNDCLDDDNIYLKHYRVTVF